MKDLLEVLSIMGILLIAVVIMGVIAAIPYMIMFGGISLVIKMVLGG